MQSKLKPIYEQVPISKVIIPEITSVFSFPPNGEKLITSIQCVGIINPVIVTPDTSGSHRIICGAKRFYACKQLGWETIPVRIIPDAFKTDNDIFDYAFSDNVSSRRLNSIECAGVITNALRLFGAASPQNSNKTITDYLIALGLPAHQFTVEIFHQLYSLEDPVKLYILQWNIPAQSGYLLTRFSSSDRTALFNYIVSLQIHGGKFKQFIELVFEIIKRSAVTVTAVFEHPTASAIFNNTKTTLSQKQAQIVEWLTAQRYPRLTEQYKKFSYVAASLTNIPAGTFSPPEHFEGEGITTAMTIKTIEELDTFCTALQDKTNREKIKKLFELL